MIVFNDGLQFHSIDPVKLLPFLEELSHICYMASIYPFLQIILSFSDIALAV